jgi:dihydroorotase
MPQVINARDIDGLWFSFAWEAGRFTSVHRQPAPVPPPTGAATLDGTIAPSQIVDAAGATIVPAAVDIHVHSRDPGITHKEDWSTMARGAARGGVAAVCDMPNTLPPTMTREAVLEKAALAERAGLTAKFMLGVGASNIAKLRELALAKDLPLGGLKVFYGKTTGEMVYDDLEALAEALPSPAEMRIPVVFHSEDQCLVDHATHEHAAELTKPSPSPRDFAVHSAVRPSAAAHKATRAILDWAATRWQGPVHIAHVSTPLEVELVAAAKAKGGRVTCEVAPHHLLFSTADYERLGARVKMNPPLRSPEEVQALCRLVGAGAVDCFATDHAPHLLSEKAAPVGKSPSGVPALELFYPLVFACAEAAGLAPAKALAMATSVPAALCGFGDLGRIGASARADFVWLERTPFLARDADVVSKCGWTPYDGWRLPARVRATWAAGQRVFTSASSGHQSERSGTR